MEFQVGQFVFTIGEWVFGVVGTIIPMGLYKMLWPYILNATHDARLSSALKGINSEIMKRDRIAKKHADEIQVLKIRKSLLEEGVGNRK